MQWRVVRGSANLATELAHFLGFVAVGLPERQVVLAEVVFEIEEQLFQAGAGHVGEFEFRLGADGSGAVAFGDVLASTASGLDHLVVGAAVAADEAFAKADGAVVDQRGGLKAGQPAVASACAQAALALRAVFGEVGHGRWFFWDWSDPSDLSDRTDLLFNRCGCARSGTS